MIKLAVIGTGRMGTYHTRLAALHEDIILTALINPSAPSAELCALAPHLPHYTDCIDQVDAVIIATPTPTHFEIARDFLAAGKHVLVEKPITLSSQHAQELFALAAEHNVTLHVGHVERYNAGLRAAQELITTPRVITTTRSGPFHPRVAGDSVVLDLMIHDIDLVMRLAGCAPTSIHALGSKSVSAQPDTAIVNLSFGNGMLASLVVHRGAASATRCMTIEQPSDTLHVDFSTQTVAQYPADDDVCHHTPEKTNALGMQLNHFVAAIKGEQPRTNALHDLSVLETTLTIAAQITTQLTPHYETSRTAAI